MCVKYKNNRLQIYQKPKSAFCPFITELCLIVGIKDNDKAELPTLAEFILADSTDADCRSAFARKPYNHFNADSDGVFV